MTQDIILDMEMRANEVVTHMVSVRADAYARRPQQLDALMLGLSDAPPRALLAYVDSLIERETTMPRAKMGFGGEVTLINLQAARLYAQRLLAAEGACA